MKLHSAVLAQNSSNDNDNDVDNEDANGIDLLSTYNVQDTSPGILYVLLFLFLS